MYQIYDDVMITYNEDNDKVIISKDCKGEWKAVASIPSDALKDFVEYLP